MPPPIPGDTLTSLPACLTACRAAGGSTHSAPATTPPCTLSSSNRLALFWLQSSALWLASLLATLSCHALYSPRFPQSIAPPSLVDSLVNSLSCSSCMQLPDICDHSNTPPKPQGQARGVRRAGVGVRMVGQGIENHWPEVLPWSQAGKGSRWYSLVPWDRLCKCQQLVEIISSTEIVLSQPKRGPEKSSCWLGECIVVWSVVEVEGVVRIKAQICLCLYEF